MLIHALGLAIRECSTSRKPKSALSTVGVRRNDEDRIHFHSSGTRKEQKCRLVNPNCLVAARFTLGTQTFRVGEYREGERIE